MRLSANRCNLKGPRATNMISDGNSEMYMADSVKKIRIDKWLWAARFFKTRSLASRAVNGGKVHLNGARIKASKVVQNDDILHIVKGNLEFTVKVLGVLQYRRPASEARELYEETIDSAEARKEKSEMMKLFHSGRKSPEKRPGKRDRRKIREFTRKD